MNATKTFISLFILPLFVTGVIKSDPKKISKQSVRINWVKEVPGDFSFRNKWSYPDNIFKDEYGQLVCDGDCPDKADAMKDSNGRIYKDSLKAYYKIIDTTRQVHSIKCQAWCYEWAGTDYIDVIQTKDSVYCYTACNAATHCSLNLELAKDNCYPSIVLKSIVYGRDAIYYCTGGYINIDKRLWQKGIVKATFNFNFQHEENPRQPMYWKGKIYARIKKQSTF